MMVTNLHVAAGLPASRSQASSWPKAPVEDAAATFRTSVIRRSSKFLALALIVAVIGTSFPAFAANITAPAKNWVLPLFSKEGHRSMTARGSEARLIDDNHFEVVDLNLTLFTGDEAPQVDTILLSPAATFLPDQKIAHGEKTVRFIGDEIEASGTRWVYRHAAKKISLDGNVRVTFRAELKNLLQ